MPKDGEQRAGWFPKGVGLNSKPSEWVAFPVTANTKVQVQLKHFQLQAGRGQQPDKSWGALFLSSILHDKEDQ
jgi:hypothetical protein